MSNKILLVSAFAVATILPFTITTAQANSRIVTESAATDTVITAKIKALYAKSALIKATDIQVTTLNKNVVLSGQVMTKQQYERAIILADSVAGVKAINVDNLSVKASKAPLTDSYTTAKVRSSFLKEKLFGSKNIDLWPVKVETKDSVVYLTGTVPSSKKRSDLIQIAQAVSGVLEVKSSITVQ